MNFHLDASPITFATYLHAREFILPSYTERHGIPIPVSSMLAFLSIFLPCLHKYHSRNQLSPLCFPPSWESLWVIGNVSSGTLLPSIFQPSSLITTVHLKCQCQANLSLPPLRPHSWSPALACLSLKCKWPSEPWPLEMPTSLCILSPHPRPSPRSPGPSRL